MQTRALRWELTLSTEPHEYTRTCPGGEACGARGWDRGTEHAGAPRKQPWRGGLKPRQCNQARVFWLAGVGGAEGVRLGH